MCHKSETIWTDAKDGHDGLILTMFVLHLPGLGPAAAGLGEGLAPQDFPQQAGGGPCTYDGED
jgi:hypothetical protein